MKFEPEGTSKSATLEPTTQPHGAVARTVGWSDTLTAYPYHKETMPPVFRGIRRCLGPGTYRIADLGCGNGYAMSLLAEQGHDVVGVEASEDGLEFARRAYPNLHILDGSIYDNDLPDKIGNGFDCVTALEVVEHLFFPKELFHTARRLLRPGGWVIVSTPYNGYLKSLAVSVLGAWDERFMVSKDGGHIKFFSPKTLAAMMEECGFELMRFEGKGRLPYLWKVMVLCARLKESP